MSVHQKPDGRWCVAYSRGGKQKWRYFGRGDLAQRQAEEYDDILRTASAKGKRSLTFSELANRYLEVKTGLIAETTLNNMYWKFDSIIFPTIGHIPSAAINIKTMDEYVAKRLQTVKKTTIHRELSDIQAVLNWAVSREYLFQNPIAGLAKPSRDDAIIDPPTELELRNIWENAADHLRRAVLLAYFTGVRPGRAELYALRFSDVNWEQETITVRSARKGGPAVRRIPLHPRLLSMLNQWYDADEKDDELHIVTYRKRPVKSVRTAWKRAKERAGIKRRLRLYDLRHAAITNMIRQGGDLKTVSVVAGHSREDTTLRHYAHTDTALARETVNRIPDPLAKP